MLSNASSVYCELLSDPRGADAPDTPPPPSSPLPSLASTHHEQSVLVIACAASLVLLAFPHSLACIHHEQCVGCCVCCKSCVALLPLTCLLDVHVDLQAVVVGAVGASRRTICVNKCIHRASGESMCAGACVCLDVGIRLILCWPCRLCLSPAKMVGPILSRLTVADAYTLMTLTSTHIHSG